MNATVVITAVWSVLLVGGLALLVAYFVRTFGREDRRTGHLIRLRRACRERGWKYHRFERACTRFTGAPFAPKQGEHGPVYPVETAVVEGSHAGRRFVTFRLDSGEEFAVWSVYALEIGILLPHLTVVDERQVDRLLQVVLTDDLTLESEAFNRAFRIRCDDREFATGFLSPIVMEYFLEHRPSFFTVQDGWLIDLWPAMPSESYTLESIDAQLDFLTGLTDRLPRHLASRHSLP